MRSRFVIPMKYGIGLFIIMFCWAAWAQPVYEQTIELSPGWNSVYLEVQPEPSDPEMLFQGLPVESVWTYVPRTSSVDFVRNPNEGLWNVPNWLVYKPEGQLEAVTTNLYKIAVNRCYLIQIGGTQQITWTVSGTPSLRKTKWVPNSLNLVGFPLDPDAPPTFRDYFEPSEAHAGQEIYQLNSNGTWGLIPDTTPMKSGEAYWVYCDGTSEYFGLLDIDSMGNSSFDYDTLLNEKQLLIKNLSDSGSITFEVRPSANPLALSYWHFDEEEKVNVWPEFPSIHTIDAPQGYRKSLRLGVRRADFIHDNAEQILEIRDGMGSRYLLPLKAKVYRPPGYSPSMSRAAALTGLWAGRVSIRAVSESQTGSQIPTAVSRAFNYRIIVHVDANGVARLLKHVVFMYTEGSYRQIENHIDPAQPLYEVSEIAKPVLLTDESRIPEFEGVVLLDSGDLIGRRLSTVAYDFEGSELEMVGNFGEIGNAIEPYKLVCNIILERDHPTNPFLHRYHPDHNNLDPFYLPYDTDPATGEPVVEESFKVTRIMEFGFTEEPPTSATPLGWGSSLLGGIFRETLSGLHKHDIVVEGEFRLELVSSATELNLEVVP